jgi:hypothetical protein
MPEIGSHKAVPPLEPISTITTTKPALDTVGYGRLQFDTQSRYHQVTPNQELCYFKKLLQIAQENPLPRDCSAEEVEHP